MAMMMSTLVGDAALVYAFQAVLLLLLVLARLKESGRFNEPTGADAAVDRGEASWNMLNLSFGIIAVDVLQIINGADDSVKFKVLWGALDLAAMIYLFFVNDWSRNRVLELVARSRRSRQGRRDKTGDTATFSDAARATAGGKRLAHGA